MLDLITIGDSTIDTFIKISEAKVQFDPVTQKQELCVGFGDKIPVEKLVHLVAGNAANNAVGASRLGLKTAIYTNVGSESTGKEIIATLKAEQVNTQNVVVHDGMESNSSAVITFKGERTIFVYHQQWDYKLPELDRSKWVYYTSLSASFVHSEINREIADFIERTGARLFYNPGTYQLQAGVKKFPKLLALSEVLIVNLEEAKKILGIDLDQQISIKKLLNELKDLGPKIVIITDSKKGSYAVEATTYYQMGVFPAEIVETTGAGDAFATGVLAALSFGKSLDVALRFGSANAASVVEQIGPQAGLLNFAQMQARLTENIKIVAKELK